MAHPFIAQLCHDLRYDMPPSMNAQEAYPFSFGKNLTLAIKISEAGFYFQGLLGACPASGREDLFMQLMHANLFGEGTGGSVISLDEESKWLTLSLALPTQVAYKQFKEQLEDFVNYLELWQGKILSAKS